MRVIAGTAKGTRLAAPKGLDIRPTLDRVRESLFNILAPDVEDTRFLDLFAGTGANGIEALSRGAQWCGFVDHNVRAIHTIRRNLEAAKLTARAKVWRLSLPAGLGKTTPAASPCGIVFADPPHKFADYDRLFSEIHRYELLERAGILVVEHNVRTNLEEIGPNFERTRTLAFGDTALSFFRLTTDA